MSDMTKCLIEKIKSAFETIELIVGGELHLDDIRHPKYLRSLIAATEKTYVLLNDGICESLEMCQECAKRRDMLMQYLHLLDDFERGNLLSSSQTETLLNFPREIDEILKRIEHVLRHI
jgi:hypothetical protein